MSTYCYIRCLDCPDDAPGNASGDIKESGIDILATFLRARAAIDAFAASDAFQYVEGVSIPYMADYPDPFMFIAGHRGHRLVLTNEYGDLYDEQGELVEKRALR